MAFWLVHIELLITCFLANGQNGIFNIPPFGQKSIGLGRLYNAYEHKFLPGMSFWRADDVKEFTDVINHPKEESFWTGSLTEEEKYDLLNIDVTGSVGLALPDILGKVKATGSLQYLQEDKVNKF